MPKCEGLKPVPQPEIIFQYKSNKKKMVLRSQKHVSKWTQYKEYNVGDCGI